MTEKPSTRDRVLADVAIAAPADAVWDAIRDPAKIANWFGWGAETLTEEIDFIFVEHAEADEAARVLHFGGMPDRFEVEVRGEASVLRLVRAMPADAVWEDGYDDIVEGWISFVQQLRLAMDLHDLGERRTIFLEGTAKPGERPPIAALGLADAAATAPGASVSVTLSTGEHVDALAWHRSPYQFGLTVPQWGNGLLIATDKSVTGGAPDGRGMVILTTYGLSDASFDEIEARWKRWWDEHFMKSSEPAQS